MVGAPQAENIPQPSRRGMETKGPDVPGCVLWSRLNSGREHGIQAGVGRREG